jgi:hypothetical protein
MPITTWLLGRDVQYIGVAPCSVDPATGAVTVGTEVKLLDNTVALASQPPAVCEMVEIEYDPVKDRIVGVGRQWSNTVVTERATRVTVAEIYSKTVGTKLADIVTVADYAQVRVQRNGKTWQYIGTVGRFTEPLQPGKLVARLELDMVDINGPNPTYL